jgi:high-affinity K+ transport system ATPase subunit B
LSRIARERGTPLAVAKDKRLLAMIHLKEVPYFDRNSRIQRRSATTVQIASTMPNGHAP